MAEHGLNPVEVAVLLSIVNIAIGGSEPVLLPVSCKVFAILKVPGLVALLSSRFLDGKLLLAYM